MMILSFLHFFVIMITGISGFRFFILERVSSPESPQVRFIQKYDIEILILKLSNASPIGGGRNGITFSCKKSKWVSNVNLSSLPRVFWLCPGSVERVAHFSFFKCSKDVSIHSWFECGFLSLKL